MGTFEVELNAFCDLIWIQGYEQEVECIAFDKNSPVGSYI